MILNALDREPISRDAIDESLRLALRLLARREHSRLELVRKLTARGFDSQTIEVALDRLVAEGALDESRLAEHYVRERIGKGFGPARIRGELREKGLAEAVIERHLASMSEDWPTCLAQAHDRRFGHAPPIDRADYAKRARFLEQRGFTPDSIRRLLRLHD